MLSITCPHCDERTPLRSEDDGDFAIEFCKECGCTFAFYIKEDIIHLYTLKADHMEFINKKNNKGDNNATKDSKKISE